MAHGIHHPSLGDLFWPAANFALFALLFIRFLRAPIQEFFRSRATRLRQALEAGAAARQEAERLRAELEHALADLPALQARLKADLRTAAEHERDKLVAFAGETAERIRTDAQLVAEQETATARATLRGELVAEAVREARDLLYAALAPDDHARLVRDFMQATERRT